MWYINNNNNNNNNIGCILKINTIPNLNSEKHAFGRFLEGDCIVVIFNNLMNCTYFVSLLLHNCFAIHVDYMLLSRR